MGGVHEQDVTVPGDRPVEPGPPFRVEDACLLFPDVADPGIGLRPPGGGVEW
jgi:hypothetical protein